MRHEQGTELEGWEGEGHIKVLRIVFDFALD